MKPIMNLEEVEFDDVEENGLYTSSRGQISDHIGAKKLGCLERFSAHFITTMVRRKCS